MTMPESVHDDLQKRIDKMNLSECRRMLENMPEIPSSVDAVIMSMLQHRIEELQQEGVEDCDG